MKGTHSDYYSETDKALSKRYAKTLNFIDQTIKPPSRVLDLGTNNLLAEKMRSRGFKVENTAVGQDLDEDYEIVKGDYDCVTAFEIFEHMVAPYNLLKEIKAPTLLASVPLNLWFASAYWNSKDEWDRHYHEFEPKQFDMLLQKAGWKILRSERWKGSIGSIGLRPLLRSITDRYYIVHCERR